MDHNELTRILLVDDDRDDYEILRNHLSDIETNRFELDWERSYERARSRIREQSHDVYLIDYRLGEHTGLELFEEMKVAGCRKPMIVLTGYADTDIDQAAMRAGVADYLVKAQVTPHLLERSIRYAMHRASMEQQLLVQDRLASIGLLTSGIAHDIGTPLGVIRGRAEYLAMLLSEDPAISPQHRKNVEVIISEIDRISHMIKALLGFSRGVPSESVGQVSLASSIHRAIELLDHEFRKSSITVENQVSEHVSAVRGDAERFQQVLINILMNSIHALETATKASREKLLIRISTQEQGGFVILKIADNGCGISKENLGQLFKPFFTTKRPGEGTGLGLVTAGWLMQLWGGKITVESEENVGTCFSIHMVRAGQ